MTGRVMAVAVLALCAWPAWAVELKLLDVKATPHSELTTRKAVNGVETGVQQILRPATGKMLVYLTFKLQVTWDAATDSVSFDHTKFHLDQGNALAPYRGLMDPYGELYLQDQPGTGAYRPFDWEEKKQPSITEVKGWWEVANSAKQLTLHVGDQTATVKIDGKPEPYAPTEDFGMQIVGTKLHDSLTRELGYDNKFKVQYVNEGGRLLEVQVKVTPKFKAADTEAGQRLWSTLSSQRFYLTFGKGGRAVALGHLDSSKQLQEPGGMYFFAEDPTKPQTVSVFFPIPSNLKTFEMYYHGRRAAEGKVGP